MNDNLINAEITHQLELLLLEDRGHKQRLG